MYANTGNNKIVNPRHEADELPLLTNPFFDGSGILSEAIHPFYT